MDLIVTCKELRYAGRTYLTGARFVASEKDGKLLKAVNKAADAPAPTTPLREAASAKPSPAPAPPPEPAADAPPSEASGPAADLDAAEPSEARTYRTRRLKAEE